MHFHSKSRHHAQLKRREIWKVLKEVFWKVLKRGNSFGVIKLLRARCSSLWGFPFCPVGDLSKVRFQINGIFCFQMNCIFCHFQSCALLPQNLFISLIQTGFNHKLLWGFHKFYKSKQKISSHLKNATKFPHTQRHMCKELFFLNTSHQWWLWRFCGQARCRYRNPGFHALSLAPALLLSWSNNHIITLLLSFSIQIKQHN